MTDLPSRTPLSPSPKIGPPVLPPLSKFYCGPTQGWHSTEPSPNQNESTWTLAGSQQGSASSPLVGHSPIAASQCSSSRRFQATRDPESPQTWRGPSPGSTFLTKQHVEPLTPAVVPKNPSTNQGWDSRPNSSALDRMTWGIASGRKDSEINHSGLPPALPVLASSTSDLGRPSREQSLKRLSPSSKYSSQQFSVRGSATTIDVPLFLQPPLHDPETAPPLPAPLMNHAYYQSTEAYYQSLQTSSLANNLTAISGSTRATSNQDLQDHAQQPSRDPKMREARRPKFDPQHSLNYGHMKKGSGSSIASFESQQRPRFDPQNSHESIGLSNSWHTKDHLPTRNHAMPLLQSPLHREDQDHGLQHEPAGSSMQATAPVTDSGTVESSVRIPRTEPGPEHASFLESQHNTLQPPDGRSMTATDASSNVPATSTPESHETTNTSFRGSEPHNETSQYDEESNDSFYWHSGRSSSEEDDEARNEGESGKTSDSTPQNKTPKTVSDHFSKSTARDASVSTSVTVSRHSRSLKKEANSNIEERPEPAANHETPGHPARSSSLSPNPAISYTASALGIGGPSDWEYFGDYEAEEIDDEDLYTHKPRAELPADQSEPQVSDYGLSGSLDGGSQVLPPQHHLDITTEKVGDNVSLVLKSVGNTFEDSNVPESRWSPSTTPTTPHANSSRPITVTSEPLPEDHRPDLDDVIRAWSDSPHVGRMSSVASSKHAPADNAEDRGDPTEASLASSPGENVLGIYSIPKDAPPIPRLPDTIDLNVVSASLKELKQTANHGDKTKDGMGQASAKLPPSNTGVEQHTMAEKVASDVRDAPSAEVENDSSDIPRNGAVQEDPVPSEPVGDPPTKPLQHLGEKAVGTVELSRSVTPGTSTPSSDFARKRQLFESSNDKSALPPSIPRKPLRELKTKAENPSVSLRQKVSMASLAERPFTSGSTPPSANGSFQSSHLVSPSISRIASHEVLASFPKSGTRSTMVSSEASDTAQIDDLTKSPPSPDSKILPSQEPRQVAPVSLSEKAQDRRIAKVDSAADDPTLGKASEAPQFGDEAFTGPLQQHENFIEGLDAEKISRSDSNAAPPVEQNSETTLDAVDECILKASPQDKESQDIVTPEILQSQAGELTDQIAGIDSGTAIVSDDAGDKATESELRGTQSESEPTVTIDPYADLDPWGRASLNRFAAMLREEARAESNKDKLNIFNVFTSRESRLRFVLYGTEEEILNNPLSSQGTKGTVSRTPSQKPQHLAKAGSTRKVVSKHSIMPKLQREAKELPPLPPNRDSVVNLPSSNLKTSGTVPDEPLNAPEHMTNGHVASNNVSKDNDGRNTLQIQAQATLGNESTSSQTRPARDHQSSQPMGAGERIKLAESERLPIRGQEAGKSRAIDRDGEVKNYLTNRRSIYRPFATQTAESIEHAAHLGREPDLSADVPVVPDSQIIEAEPATPANTESTIEPQERKPLDLRRFVDADFDPLALVLPSAQDLPGDPPQLEGLRTAMDAVPDDFSFIHACVVAWDAKVKVQREVNDRERHLRQMGSEQRIDALFDDHEIGYGDIAELEGEFKQAEAARKAEEDRSEYKVFVEDVFNVVWTRLNYEMDQLKPHYEKYIHLMDETLAGKDAFDKPENLSLAPTMTAFLGLHQKLEIRYQKAFEAVLERDRRLKKTEISPWYSLSNLDKVKQLEKQFEDAEKQAIINYCEQRAARANELMDVLDQNTLRGVGANQDYMEAVMKAVRRIAAGRAFASLPGTDGPTLGIELVEKAKTVTSSVARSSEQIVQTFHVADMLLNNADFEVSMAKVKVAKADTATLSRLREERAKEDQKLMRDLEHRLALIREDNRRTNDEIVKLMLFLGLQNGKALSTQAAPPALGVKPNQTNPVDSATTAGAQEVEGGEGLSQPT